MTGVSVGLPAARTSKSISIHSCSSIATSLVTPFDVRSRTARRRARALLGALSASQLRSPACSLVVRKYAAQNALFKEIVESQLAFAKRATQWEQDYVVNRRMAYEHYWAPNAKKPI